MNFIETNEIFLVSKFYVFLWSIKIFSRKCTRHIALKAEKNIASGPLASIYLFKVNNRNNRAMCGICSKLTVSIVDFEQVNVGWDLSLG